MSRVSRVITVALAVAQTIRLAKMADLKSCIMTASYDMKNVK
ncbi:hypothetical protein GLIP_0698 [Aliiglaciecola lipolytica E3]|uniref:Uncharacterized protein n=1 Tax=Aliiglaciecola lipolytica E3 TaxID=1127673 RepID=K6WY20_9ALTE|nr:hypothetical protein GLIP_0698 [Aliiglaciecola lipolytica E3]